MTSLSELNKLNREIIEQTRDLDNWHDCANLGHDTLDITSAYRNKLLGSLKGQTITCKGYLVDMTNSVNFIAGLVEIYNEKGIHIDTVQHIALYVDILSNNQYLRLNGEIVAGKGQYDDRELRYNLNSNIDNNVSYTNCQEIKFTGIVYKYGTKWSVGTERQVEYASK